MVLEFLDGDSWIFRLILFSLLELVVRFLSFSSNQNTKTAAGRALKLEPPTHLVFVNLLTA